MKCVYTHKQNIRIDIMFNMFQFFEKNPNNKHSSLLFLSPRSTPENVFRGDIKDFINRNGDLSKVDTVELAGTQISLGVYDSSPKLDSEELKTFMKLVNERKIKALSFDGCTLDPNAGKIIGAALKENHSLGILAVCTSQLEEPGVLAVLDGLKNNESLKMFHGRSYNIQRYYWSPDELKALQDVITSNTSLQHIVLPDNQIGKPRYVNILSEPYKTINDRELASIHDLELCLYKLPEFNKENASNGKLDEYSQIKFQRPGYRD